MPFILSELGCPGGADECCFGSTIDVKGSVVDAPGAVCALSKEKVSRVPGALWWWMMKRESEVII